ncbi:Uncharacterized protein GBIM_04526 [Gryllus bimaculatus]|nr:Uncharacterized protein GBIM_04526 [Gryllus bimaculatus]
MLQPIKQILDSQRIVLASTSPRRKEILTNLGLKFEVCPSLYDEKNLDPSNYPSPSAFVVDTAFRKVEEVARRLGNSNNSSTPDLIIGADTVVSLEGIIFGKPDNEDTAFKMLKQLSGRHHEVYTGVTLMYQQKTVKFFDSTKVYFSSMSDETIQKYIETGEPLDKAGGYGIQGPGGSLIEKIDGDFYTVMGLPLHKLCRHILELYNS